MSASPELEALLRPEPRLGVPLPRYDGRSLPNVASSVVRALGGEAGPLALPSLADGLDPFGGRRTEGPVLLLVIDGLGFERLRTAAAEPDARWARHWLTRGRPITTVFPSTTTVALSSLSTASSPSRHGLVGYRQYLPAYGAVVEMLRQSPLGVAQDDALLGPSWSPSIVLGAPTIFRDSVAGAVVVSRDRFEGRGFTRLLYDGATFEPYATFAEMGAALTQALSRAPAPPLVVGYWDELDTVQHLRGPASPWAALEVERIGGLLAAVGRAVPRSVARSTTVLLTADHGLVAIEPARQTAFDAEPTILEHLARPPTGDRRVGLLKARPGELAALEAAVVARMPPGTRSLPAEAAIDGGLFGPPPYHPELRERVGDLVVLAPSPGGITYTIPGRPRAPRHLVGGHGGLEAEELVVPLVAGTLEELANDSRPR